MKYKYYLQNQPTYIMYLLTYQFSFQQPDI